MPKRFSSTTPVAIIGMACRLPGASNLDDFWRMLYEGRSAMQPLPESRLDRSLLYHPEKGVRNKTYADIGCLVEDREYQWRRTLFPKKIAEHPEPTYSLLIDAVASALDHAGYDPFQLPYRNTGVYLGHTRNSGLSGDQAYFSHIPQVANYLHQTESFKQHLGSSSELVIEEVAQELQSKIDIKPTVDSPAFGACVAARLVSEAFGLTGPTMSFNAACASSLHGLIQAVRALQLNRIDMALACGSSYCHCDTLVLFSQAQSLSAHSSRPWDADADGLVVGEGTIVLALKLLPRAVEDRDKIYGVIRGVGLSSDGKGKSLWAPRKEGQVEAIRRAYGTHLNIERLQYIEAHATSTQVGDATEMSALAEAVSEHLPRNVRLPIGSVKANIGHTLEVAGLAGLLKTLVSMQHCIIPPAINIENLNQKIDWDNIPFYVPSAPQDWNEHSDGHPRRAAVNAFGIGGLNTHVVIDEFQTNPKTAFSTPLSLKPITHSDREDAIAIVGAGTVLPGARTIDVFWDLLSSNKSAITDPPDERNQIDSTHRNAAAHTADILSMKGGYIRDFEYDWRRHKVPPKQISNSSPLQFMVLDAVDQAIRQSGYDEKPFDRKKVGVIVGNIFGGDFSNQLQVGLKLPQFQRTLTKALLKRNIPEQACREITEEFAEVLLKHKPALTDETGSFTSSSLASRITKSFDLMGGAASVDAGAPSSFAALSCCIDLLLSGDTDMMVCVGAQQDMSISRYQAMNLNGMIPESESTATPFDENAQGTFPGEGCGVVLLKRLEDAKQDGDTIHGIIRGIGAAFHPRNEERIVKACTRAFEDGDLCCDKISSIETTGSGISAVDSAEIEGLAAAYRNKSNTAPKILGTLLGQIGHTGSASGMAALLKTTKGLQDLSLPGSLGFHQPAAYLKQYDWLFEVPTKSTRLKPINQDGCVFGAVHSSGIHDAAYHVIIERSEKIKPPEIKRIMNPQLGNKSQSEIENEDGILHFDATLRRKEKMKAAAHNLKTKSSNHDYSDFNRSSIEKNKLDQQFHDELNSTVEETSSRIEELSPPKDPSPTPGLSASELESFLVNFVVEQTGYPAEIVEMDADLEADLGIDSIKKAQLFGELREFFDITPSDDLTLDDFPSLRDVMKFLQSSNPSAATVTVDTKSRSTTSIEEQSNGTVEAREIRTLEEPESPGLSASELESFLVNFVVEQTGYPAEIVEMDADLEADLGIDSIKKAQLFGELREYFDITPSDDLSLDDFPTLRDVMNFLSKSPAN